MIVRINGSCRKNIETLKYHKHYLHLRLNKIEVDFSNDETMIRDLENICATEKVGGTLLETLSCKDTTENDMMIST